jgi:hypothetical protein
MGLGFALLVWAVLGAIAATIGSIFLGTVTFFAVKGTRDSRTRAVTVSAIFPFACLLWVGLVFLFQLFVNTAILGRDPGIGDTWTTSLPNGYAVLMIDVTDHGVVYNPRTQSDDGSVVAQPDAVFHVRRLQVADRYILGSSDTRLNEHSGQVTQYEDSYFLLDTQTDQRTDFPNYGALTAAGAKLGISPNLQPIDAVYGKYQSSWFELFAAALLLLPPLAAGVLLLKWIARVRTEAKSLA